MQGSVNIKQTVGHGTAAIDAVAAVASRSILWHSTGMIENLTKIQ